MASNLKDVVEKYIAEGRDIKLHLGCGPNLFEGWINVEGEYLKHMDDIVLHDITQPMPIPDNCVSEILTVHVIEHIMPSDVDALLKEWLRVLKPGGFVATEWPDLLKACQFIVDDPSRIYTDNQKTMKRAVGAIFGRIDKYQDVTMLHKWGYSADSMIELKKRCGFSKVESQSPQYPKTKKPMIDSRVVGYKSD